MMRTLKQATETRTDTSAPTSSSFPTGLPAFTANRKELLKALKRVALIADRRSSIKVLGSVAIICDGQTVSLVTTDLNNTAAYTSDSWIVSQPGATTVNVKALVDVISKITDADVTLTACDVSGLVITSGPVSVRLDAALAESHFPKVPRILPGHRIDGDWCDGADLASAIESVEHAVCQDETRFHLNGVFIERGIVVATDGHRLAKHNSPSPRNSACSAFSSGVILPKRGAVALRKMLADGSCEVAKLGHHVVVRQGANAIAIKTIDAQFPPWRQVIPSNNLRRITVDRLALIAALKRALVLCSATRGAKLVANERTLRVQADLDGSSIDQAIEARHGRLTGNSKASIGINPRYLIEACETFASDEVTLSLSEDERKHKGCEYPNYQLDPILVTSTSTGCDTADALHVIMPMRI